MIFSQAFLLFFNPIIFHDFSFYNTIRFFNTLLGDVGFKFSTGFSDASILYLLTLSSASLLDCCLVLKYKTVALWTKTNKKFGSALKFATFF